MQEQLLNNLHYIGIFIVILITTFIIAYLAGSFFRRLILRSSLLMKTDPTNYQFLRHSVVGMIYILGFCAAIYSIPVLRTLAGSMLAGAGIVAVAVGFASQHALSNIISGFFIVIFKPFRVNDRVKLREMTGIIEDITLRHTVIRDFENQRIIIPNAVISDEIITNSNFGEDAVCRFINVGISYESDVQLAKAIIAEEIHQHPLFVDRRTSEQIESGEPIVVTRVIQLGEYSVNIRGWAWTLNVANGFILGCDVNESILERFNREGIEIPYPHRTVVMKNIADNDKL
ncbi:MAG: mechanosensitive ion channel family protein [Saprospiraceae bacterium]